MSDTTFPLEDNKLRYFLGNAAGSSMDQHVRIYFLYNPGVGGFRLEGGQHIEPKDLNKILSSLKNLNTVYFPSNSRAAVIIEVRIGPL